MSHILNVTKKLYSYLITSLISKYKKVIKVKIFADVYVLKPCVNFTDILRPAFTPADRKSMKKYSYIISIFLCFRDLRAQKLYVERWWNWGQGSISPTCLHKAFAVKDPKSAKRQSSHKRLFVLLGYARPKAVHSCL